MLGDIALSTENSIYIGKTIVDILRNELLLMRIKARVSQD